jgi:hypothetical protein
MLSYLTMYGLKFIMLSVNGKSCLSLFYRIFLASHNLYIFYFFPNVRLAPPQPTLSLDPNVSGLPPKSPVYAVVNKVNKKKQQGLQQQQQQPQSPQRSQQQQQNVGLQYHNYCNVAPLLGDVVKQSGNEFHQESRHQNNGGGHYYENSAAVLARLNTGASLPNSAAGMGDYIPMDSQMFQVLLNDLY